MKGNKLQNRQTDSDILPDADLVILINHHIFMAWVCTRVAPLARFHIDRARILTRKMETARGLA